MNEPKRRFFSGDSLQQALVQAANYHNLDPDWIAYRSLEKKHGFLKTRRKVVIEVDPDAPKREKPVPVPPAAPVLPPAPSFQAAQAAQAVTSGAPARPDDAPPRLASPERRGPREEPPPREVDGNRAPPRMDQRGERRNDLPGRPGRNDRGDRGGDRNRRGGAPPRYARDPSRDSTREPERPREERAAGAAVEPRRPMPDGGLVALPDTPRRTAERFPPATGPMAEAAAKGAELLLRIAGLDLTPRVLQGEDRLEVDLSGPDVDWCFADDGELVMAVEHLLPRLIRTLSGETTLVRVDCDNFQEIREERLRSLAQQVAEEVRRRGKPRTLEPMNPADRRIVHMTLADDPGVLTESDGDGYFKRITVRPA
jgi:spoIIIJ-associated protein